ncbi:MAG: hypothetical protein MUE69_01895 [Myxococcota bacterium]|nr:hypothetical protein [Myxococcota bacterium]
MSRSASSFAARTRHFANCFVMHFVMHVVSTFALVASAFVASAFVASAFVASAFVASAFVASAFVASSASAQDAGVPCDEPPFRGPLEVTPASGAGGVTIDARVKVLYGEGTLGPELDPESLIDLRHCGDLGVFECETAGELVPGRAQIVGDRWVFFVPDGELLANAQYAGIARGAEGNLSFTFRTGIARDLRAPLLGNVAAPSTARTDLPCDGGRGFRVDVRFDAATDDGPAGSIEYLLYLTRGATVEAPELRTRVRSLATSEVTMAFLLSDAEAVAPVCFVVHAVDGLGNVDSDGEPVCFEPVQGTYFEACSVSAPGATRELGAGAFGVGFVGLALGVRRRRAARARTRA